MHKTLSNIFNNLNQTNLETCYKLFKADVIKNLDLKVPRYGYEPEITTMVLHMPNIRIYEMGI